MNHKDSQGLLELAIAARLETIRFELQSAAAATLQRVRKVAAVHAESGPVDNELLEMQCLDVEDDLHETLHRWLAYAPARLVEDELSGILLWFAEAEAARIEAGFDTEEGEAA